MLSSLSLTVAEDGEDFGFEFAWRHHMPTQPEIELGPHCGVARLVDEQLLDDPIRQLFFISSTSED